MVELPEMSFQMAMLGFALAAAIGFLIGRTRSDDEGIIASGRPGMRDFVMISLLGATCALVNIQLVTASVSMCLLGVVLAVRLKNDMKIGITSEFAVFLMFLLGYLCHTKYRDAAAAVGVLVALILATKQQVNAFALKRISEKEFSDTLKFLALIFIIYPLLPKGAYGIYDFFEPRKVWIFVILISAVSYIGYFLIKFIEGRRGLVMTAIFGGIASTTAYITGTSNVVKNHPEAGASLGVTSILADSMLYLRILLVLMIVNPHLAEAAFLPMISMAAVEVGIYFFLDKIEQKKETSEALVGNNFGFTNPFAFKSALKFGGVFVLVLFITKVGANAFQSNGELISSAIGGLINLDAVVLSMSDFALQDVSLQSQAVLGILIGSTANAIFKFIVACTSRNKAFYLRIGFSFLLMLSVGFLVYWIEYYVMPLPIK